MSCISPGPLGVSCQPKKCDSYSLLCASAAPRSQDSMQLELTVLNVHMSALYVYCIASLFTSPIEQLSPFQYGRVCEDRGPWGAMVREDPRCVFIPLGSNQMSTGGDIWTTVRVERLLTCAFPTFYSLSILTCIQYVLIKRRTCFFLGGTTCRDPLQVVCFAVAYSSAATMMHTL